MRCAEVREALPAYVRDGNTTLALRRHVADCPGCTAELQRYEALLGALDELRTSPAEPPPGLLQTLVSIPASTGATAPVRRRVGALGRHLSRNQRVYLGSAGVAIAGAVGALVLTRVRRPATA